MLVIEHGIKRIEIFKNLDLYTILNPTKNKDSAMPDPLITLTVYRCKKMLKKGKFLYKKF